MNPIQFEHLVALDYESKGYSTEMTPKSYDYGVDFIAFNRQERIAVQVKMYENRNVNYKDVMYLFAGKELYDCNSGHLITAGVCDSKAIQVAEKLGIFIRENYRCTDSASKLNFDKEDSNLNYHKDFDELWIDYIKPLSGKTVYTASGSENVILEVTGDYVKRKSSTGKTSKVDKHVLRTIFYRLMENKSITRKEINTEYPGRASSFIVCILDVLPMIEMRKKPDIKLVLKQH